MYWVSPEIHTQVLQKPSESGVLANHVGTDICKAIQIDPKHGGGSEEDSLLNLLYEEEPLNAKCEHTHTLQRNIHLWISMKTFRVKYQQT